MFPLFIRVARYFYFKGLRKVPGALPIFAFLFRLISPRVIHVHGSKMYMDPHAAVLLSAAALNFFEPLMTGIFEEVVKEGDTVIDVGANVGYYTLLAARIVGESGQVYAFEPEPKSYSLLIKNIGLNQYNNIIPVPRAVTSKVGSAKLFLYTNPEFDTLYKPGGRGRFIEVETETLDHFFQDKGDVINVIKMDIEGAEMDALLGMDKVISQNKNLRMFVEFAPSLIERAGHSPEEFLHKLWDYNFSTYLMDEREKQLKYISNIDEFLASRPIPGKSLFLVKL